MPGDAVENTFAARGQRVPNGRRVQVNNRRNVATPTKNSTAAEQARTGLVLVAVHVQASVPGGGRDEVGHRVQPSRRLGASRRSAAGSSPASRLPFESGRSCGSGLARPLQPGAPAPLVSQRVGGAVVVRPPRSAPTGRSRSPCPLRSKTAQWATVGRDGRRCVRARTTKLQVISVKRRSDERSRSGDPTFCTAVPVKQTRRWKRGCLVSMSGHCSTAHPKAN